MAHNKLILAAIILPLFFVISSIAYACTCFGTATGRTDFLIANCKNGLCDAGFEVWCVEFQGKCLPVSIEGQLSPEYLVLVQNYIQKQTITSGIVAVNVVFTTDLDSKEITKHQQLSITPDLTQMSSIKEKYIQASGRISTILHNDYVLSVINDSIKRLLRFMSSLLWCAFIPVFFVTLFITQNERKNHQSLKSTILGDLILWQHWRM